MNSRFLPIAIAASAAVSGLVAPTAFAQDAKEPQPVIENIDNEYIAENFINPFTLPTAQPQDVVLQVGSSQDSVMLNWVTEKNVTGQVARIREATAAADTAKVIEATSTTGNVYLTEGYKDAKPNLYTEIANHKATITGLKENTEYTYQVGAEGNWSEEFTFNTGTYGDNWNFLFFGDVQLYSDKKDDGFEKQTNEWNNTVAKAIAKYPQTAFLLSGGDQANYSALQEHSAFISPEQLRAYRTAVNNGNHDEVDFPTYQAFYNRPNTEDDSRNYWYTYNNALVISLDTNEWKDFDEDVAFLRKTVAEQGEGKDWTIVTYHHATFSQAYHMQDQVTQYHRERLAPVLSELDVDLVLSGHDHIYTRTFLMDGNQPVNFTEDLKKEDRIGETLAKEPGQVQYITANSSSGSKYYNFYDFKTQTRERDPEKNPWNFENSVENKTIRTYTAVWAQQLNPNYTNVDVTADSLKVATYDTKTDAIVDQFTLTRAGEDADNNGGAADNNNGNETEANGSARTAGIAVGVIAAVLAVLGGAAFFLAPQVLGPIQLPF